MVITSYDTVKAEHQHYTTQARNEGASAGADPVAASTVFSDDDDNASQSESLSDDESSASESGPRTMLHGRPLIYRHGKKVDDKRDPKARRDGYKDALYRVDWVRIVLGTCQSS